MSQGEFNRGMSDEQVGAQAPIQRSADYDLGRKLAKTQREQNAANPGWLLTRLSDPNTRRQDMAGGVTFVVAAIAAFLALRALAVGVVGSLLGAFFAGLVAAGLVVAAMKLFIPIVVLVVLVLGYRLLKPLIG